MKQKPEEEGYVAQIPEDCFLCHLDGEEAQNFNPKMFTLRRTTTVSINGSLSVEMNIIGESHIMRIFRDGVCVMVEILSCVDPRNKGLVCASHCFAQNPKPAVATRVFSTIAQIGETVKHTKRHTFEPVLPADPLLFNSLVFAFPGDLKPRTMLLFWVSQDYLGWSSLHEYEMEQGNISPLTSTTTVRLSGLENL